MKKIFSLLTAAVLSLSFTSCKPDEEEKTEIAVNIRNITGVAISELYIIPETFNTYGSNLIKEAVPDNSDVTLTLGSFTEEELSDGFALQATNASDGSYETFANLSLKDNDTVTFYIDAMGLALAVNTSDEEIQEMIDKLDEELNAEAASEST